MLPQNWLCQRDAFIPQTTPSSSIYLLATLMETTQTLHQTHKIHGDSKVQFLQLQHGFQNYNEHNPSHVRRHTLSSQPPQLLINPFRPLLKKKKERKYWTLHVKIIIYQEYNCKQQQHLIFHFYIHPSFI